MFSGSSPAVSSITQIVLSSGGDAPRTGQAGGSVTDAPTSKSGTGRGAFFQQSIAWPRPYATCSSSDVIAGLICGTASKIGLRDSCKAEIGYCLQRVLYCGREADTDPRGEPFFNDLASCPVFDDPAFSATTPPHQMWLICCGATLVGCVAHAVRVARECRTTFVRQILVSKRVIHQPAGAMTVSWPLHGVTQADLRS